MGPDDMARLHNSSFRVPRPWRTEEFADLLAQPAVFALQTGCDGFVLGRVVADEAELLTLAVAPGARRRGLGRNLLTAFENRASTRGAVRGILEVAVSNAAALALYRRCGWQECGRRPAYYRDPQGDAIDAVMMDRSLTGK